MVLSCVLMLLALVAFAAIEWESPTDNAYAPHKSHA
jgi:hypothetical protein